MNKGIADAWIEKLSDGSIKQGRHSLCIYKQDRGYEMCCLGVLCELARENGLNIDINERQVHGGIISERFYDGETKFLPESVMKWSGMKTAFGRFGKETDETLDYLNDQSFNFDAVIKVIKEKWEVL